MLDTNVGPVGRAAPAAEEVQRFHEWFLRCAQRLDGTSVGALFVPERHGRSDCFSPAPLELLAALAGVTSHAALGTYVLQPPLYPPVALLERLAVIDHLSAGRLVCGFGAGFHPLYFAVHGEEMSRRGAALDRFLDLMDEGWGSGSVELDGEEVYVLPPAHRPPVWLGGTSRAAVRRAARRADAFGIGFTDARVGGLIDDYRRACEEAGREPRLVLIQSAWVRTGIDAEAEMVSELGETLGPEMTLYQTHGQLEARGTITAERMARYMYVGEPEPVVAHIRADVERWGIDEVILRVHIGIPPRDAVTECLDLIADEVAPGLAA